MHDRHDVFKLRCVRHLWRCNIRPRGEYAKAPIARKLLIPLAPPGPNVALTKDTRDVLLTEEGKVVCQPLAYDFQIIQGHRM